VDWGTGSGVPSSIIERRPDIREAEQTLIGANANIGVAKAQFFPQISLTGGGGSFGRSSTFSSLMTTQLGIWSYGAQVSQPIFTGGAPKGNLHLAESQHQQALIGYREAIQHACRGRSFDCASDQWWLTPRLVVKFAIACWTCVCAILLA
jgi:multidrug efflux system outer membrane protein